MLVQLDLERLSAPISAAFPSGRNLRAEAGSGAYYRLKDLRSAARSEERFAAQADERLREQGQPLKLPQTWYEVRTLAVAALESETTDIELLAWLAEAELRLNGFVGLRDVFDLCNRVIEDRFDSLHSIEGEALEDRVAPFAGLNGVSGEGTLIQPVRLSPLVPGRAFFEASLWDFQMAQRPGETSKRQLLKDAAVEAGGTAMRAHLDGVTKCIAAFRTMTAALDARCGADAPASSGIRGVLEDVRLAITNIAGLEGLDMQESLAQSPPPMPVTTIAGDAEAVPASAVPGPIRSRDEAYDRLAEVVAYFRRTEPQSLIPLAVETAMARGRMNFSELLAELVQDEHVRRGILITAGIRPGAGGPS